MKTVWICALCCSAMISLEVPEARARLLIGSGAHTCKETLEAIHQDPNDERALIQWALGYVSGTIFTLPKTKMNFDLSAIKPNLMKQFLTAYCSQHPEAEYFEAVNKYLSSLPLKPADQ
jgi:hypothetical protein